MHSDLVFVLGAGFTRAIAHSAPLLVDDYNAPALRTRFASFTSAAEILDQAMRGRAGGIVDLEALMTRLSGMPYDTTDASRELELLSSELRKALVERIASARPEALAHPTLPAFARYVLDQGASVVTFNYDDFLDEALWAIHRAGDGVRYDGAPYWHPDSGYGFFCRSSQATIVNDPDFMNNPRSVLLKLHGSINWRSRLGDVGPRGPAAILHHEDWMQHAGRISDLARNQIEGQLEPDPFIVPPVLVKSELAAHPVLRAIWRQARAALLAATRVVFIGYSLPQTDLAARTLFSESLSTRSGIKITVVDIDLGGNHCSRVEHNYRALLGCLLDYSFDFRGAIDAFSNGFSGANQPPTPQAAV